MTGTNKKFNRGFTIVELIVVSAIFLFVIGAAISIFLSVVKNQRRVLEEQQLLNQVSYAQEYMSKAMRMAVEETDENCLMDTTFSDTDHPGFIYLLTRRNPSTGIYQGIKFLNNSDIGSNGKPACQEFFWDETDKNLKEIKNGGDATALTSQDLKMNYVKFAVDGLADQSGCASPCGAQGTTISNYQLQPRVTILLSAQISEEPERVFQTTVSQRNLNVVGGPTLSSVTCADIDGDRYIQGDTNISVCGDVCGISHNQTCLGNNDCNDTVSLIYPGATEVCNAADDDCDGTTDEGGVCTSKTYYCDSDEDGYLKSTASGTCSTYNNCPPLNCLEIPGSDCDDSNKFIYLGAPELFNGVDDDCDDIIDEGFNTIAEYKFEGNANDTSGNGNNGTVYGARLVQGKIGQGYLFDGINDYISVPDNQSLDSATDDITISMWVKPASSQASFASLIDRHECELYGWTIQQDTTILNAFTFTTILDDGNNPRGIYCKQGTGNNTQLATGSWNHFVVQKSGNEVRHYLNGVLKKTCYLPADYLFVPSDHPLKIGYSCLDRYFKGIIDEIKIWKTALSYDEILQEYGTLRECSDWKDNDSDGYMDYPSDAGCSGPSDNDERTGLQCDNGMDDDGDGFIDSNDPGCTDINDNTEDVAWTERQPAGDSNKTWRGVASDSDGSNLIAGVYGGRLYTSSDYGVTWAEKQPAGNYDKNWRPISSNSTGSNLIAGVYGGRIYTSSNSGTTWTERKPTGTYEDKYWYSAALSSNGSFMIAGVHAGRLYTSSDSGLNWTERRPDGNKNKYWYSVAADSDGSNLIAAAYDDRLYTSSDSGVTWTERRPAGDVNQYWQAVASDADGSNLIAGVLSGRIYTSSDSGVTWTERKPAGNVDQFWNTVASDSDGSSLVAGANSGRLYVSSDSGTTWTEKGPITSLLTDPLVASDSDGSNLIMGNYNGRLYTSVSN